MTSFGIHETEIEGDPRGRKGERKKFVFQRSGGLENVMRLSVGMSDQVHHGWKNCVSKTDSIGDVVL